MTKPDYETGSLSLRRGVSEEYTHEPPGGTSPKPELLSQIARSSPAMSSGAERVAGLVRAEV